MELDATLQIILLLSAGLLSVEAKFLNIKMYIGSGCKFVHDCAIFFQFSAVVCVGGRPARCARAVRKVGHSPLAVGSFLGVGLPQGTIAIVYPCSINPPPSCVYVPLQTGTLRPVYGDTFSGCLPRGIIFCSHFSDPLLHSPWTLMLEIGCSTLAPMGCEFLPQWWGLRPTD